MGNAQAIRHKPENRLRLGAIFGLASLNITPPKSDSVSLTCIATSARHASQEETAFQPHDDLSHYHETPTCHIPEIVNIEDWELTKAGVSWILAASASVSWWSTQRICWTGWLKKDLTTEYNFY